MSSPLLSSPLYLSYALLSAYCLSGCLLEHFAVFRGWQELISSSNSNENSTLQDPLLSDSNNNSPTNSKEEEKEKDRALSKQRIRDHHQQQKRQLKHLQKVNGHAIAVLYVLPKTVLTVLNAYLLVNFDKSLSSYSSSISTAIPTTGSSWFNLQRSLHLSAYMLAGSWLQSFVVMIPLQLRIREGAEKGDVDRLVRGSWVRVGCVVVHVGVVGWSLCWGG